jgi:hypothetical protein
MPVDRDKPGALLLRHVSGRPDVHVAAKLENDTESS